MFNHRKLSAARGERRMDEYLTLLGTLLGAVVGGIIGFAGAYIVEKKRFKRERILEMRNEIYGPMFMETSRILENVKFFQRTDYIAQDELKKLKDDYLFFTIEQGLKNRLSEVIDRFEKYQKVRLAAEYKLSQVAQQEVMDASGYNVGVSNVFLNLLIGAIMVSTIDLSTAVFLGLTAQDFIKKEKEKWGEDSLVDVRFAGAIGTLQQYESLYASLFAKMEKEPLYLTEKEQRVRLIKELENFLRLIEPFVKPE
jgi:hypothetical protein